MDEVILRSGAAQPRAPETELAVSNAWRGPLDGAAGTLRHSIHKLSYLSRAHGLVLAAIGIGMALRFANLNGVLPALNQDEAVHGYDAYSLFMTGRDHHGHPFPLTSVEAFGDWPSPLLSYLMMPAVGLFGLQVEVLRAVTTLTGVMAILVVYRLGVELFGRRPIGVLAAWLIAFSPWHLHLSRWAIPPSIVPTMLGLTMCLLVWSVNRRSNHGLVATAVAAALTLASYHGMKLYIPLLGGAACMIYGGSLIRFKREALVSAAAILVLTAGPTLYLAVRDPAGGARFAQTSSFNAQSLDVAFLGQQYLSYFSPEFLFVSGDGDPMHIPPGFGAELWSLMPFLLVGLAWLIVTALNPASRTHRQSALFLLAALALYPIPGCLTLPSPHALRGAHVIPLLAITAAVGAGVVAVALGRILRQTRPAIARNVLPMLVLLVGATVGAELLSRYKDYFIEYPRQVAPLFHYGLEPVLGYARAREAEYHEIWVTDVNQPYIYVLFYAKWPPSDVHQNLLVRRAPPSMNQVDAIGKYRFGIPPASWRQELPVLYSVTYPGGGIAYQARGGETKDRGRILLVQRPH